MDLKEEEILGKDINSHWYYAAKGRALLKLLKNSSAKLVLDVGAGSGVFSKLLLDKSISQQAVCVDPGYTSEQKKESHNGKEILFTRKIQEINPDLILMMDVIEHVDDDIGLIKEYAKFMSSESQLIITVPAFMLLWSGHDVFLEHKRRYTLKSLEQAVKDAGLQPVRTNYFFASLFPLIAVIRFINRIKLKNRNKFSAKSDLKKYPNFINDLLIKIHDIERLTFFPFNRLMGLTIFCVAKKPKN